MRAFARLMLLAGLLGPAVAVAAEGEPVPVTIRVMDPDGKPIGTATLRHPEEKVLHTVNAETGEWTESVLYLANGKEIVFQKDASLELEISAVGYMSQNVRYLIRKRKNIIPIVLQPMQVESGEDETDPMINFRRDRPVD